MADSNKNQEARKMGWSYTHAAGDVLKSWMAECRRQTGSSNCYRTKSGSGEERFFDASRTEHADGAITGTVWRMLPDGEHCRKVGGFRINGDGTVARKPAGL